MTKPQHKGGPLGVTAKTILDCIKANPGHGTKRIYELLQATVNPCPAWETAKKTIQNLRQQGHLENRNPISPRGGNRYPAEWHATGKPEFLRPTKEQIAAERARAKAERRAQAVQRQPYGHNRCGTPPKNKSPDGQRMLDVLAADLASGGQGMTVRQLAEAVGLTPDTARSRIEHLVSAGKMLKVDLAPPGAKNPVIRLELPGAHNARPDGRSRFVAPNRPEGQDGKRMTASSVNPIPVWHNPRPDSQDAFLLPSRRGDEYVPHSPPLGMCCGKLVDGRSLGR